MFQKFAWLLATCVKTLYISTWIRRSWQARALYIAVTWSILGILTRAKSLKIITLRASDFDFNSGSVAFKTDQPWDLLKIKIFHFLLLERAYSPWYKYECLVVSWDHIFFRASMCYAFLFKILNHLLFKASGATNKMQNGKRTRLKVSEEVCWFRLIPNEAFNKSFNPQFITARSISTPVEKRKIPRKNENIKGK